mmetsp:Transcript_19995/g.60745  ORF Transcript_19995/g.60745 Transcript_19995/m.60745 type:complete len:111 (+) Transcript_19995:1683-2015(+)
MADGSTCFHGQQRTVVIELSERPRWTDGAISPGIHVAPTMPPFDVAAVACPPCHALMPCWLQCLGSRGNAAEAAHTRVVLCSSYFPPLPTRVRSFLAPDVASLHAPHVTS